MTAMIGTDPELFLRDGDTGAVVSGVGLIGGTKDEPLQMEGLAPGFAVQEDNVMMEFNIPPASNVDEFSLYVGQALEYCRSLVRTTGQSMELDIGTCSRLFNNEQLANPQAQVFGCSADFNAHEQGRALRPPNPDSLYNDAGTGAWRFAGGHVHLGYTSEVPDFVAGAMCDVYLGLPSIALDKQGIRRGLYGSAGRYRPTDHGLEYRTLSNFWIWDEGLRRDIAMRTFNLMYRLEGDMGNLQRLFAEIPWPDVQDAINTENVTKAADLITYLNRDLQMGDV